MNKSRRRYRDYITYLQRKEQHELYTNEYNNDTMKKGVTGEEQTTKNIFFSEFSVEFVSVH